MLVVPTADALTVEVKVAPQDIDQLRLGQTASLRFSALDQGTTPEIAGKVARIAADLTQDQRTGVWYYLVRIAASDKEIDRLGDLDRVPGMPIEAFIKTRERTVMAYLMKPLADQVKRAFRED